jgi:hypothetical protein
VVALVLLLIAERNLLTEVLHAQEGLRDALGELKLTVNDEVGAARPALAGLSERAAAGVADRPEAVLPTRRPSLS